MCESESHSALVIGNRIRYYRAHTRESFNLVVFGKLFGTVNVYECIN